MDTRIDDIEERLAHLIRQGDDLSEVVAAQARRIELLERRVALLMDREAEREAEGGGSLPMSDAPPPHW